MPDLRAVAAIARAKLKPGRARATARVRRWLYPSALERDYRSRLAALGRPLASMALGAAPLAPAGGRSDSARADGWLDDLEELVRQMDGYADGLTAAGGAAVKLIADVGARAYLFNRDQWGKTTEAFLGFRYETPDAWWPDASRAWEAENARLIKNASDSFVASVNELTMRAVRTGKGPAWLEAELRKVGQGYEARLRLIAEDQVGKLNGALSKARQEEAGLDVYAWQTAGDERVRGRPGGKYPNARPSHWAMEGLWCKWSDPTVCADPATDVDRDEARGDVVAVRWRPRPDAAPDSIPGEEIRCRCTAAPVWEAFLMGA